MNRFPVGNCRSDAPSRQICCAVLLFIALIGLPWSALAGSAPPPTRIAAVVDTLHGVPISDPYRWLEDQNSPETRSWIDAQNAYTRSILDTLPGREKLTGRLGQLLKTERIGMPFERGGRYFFSKRLADQDQYVLYMREGQHGPDQMLIDPHPLSADHSVSVGEMDVSHDGKVMAYWIRRGGADENTIRLLDIDARKDLPDSLSAGVYFGFALTRDKNGFYYSRRVEDGSSRVYFHPMGGDPAKDSLVFGSGYGPELSISCWISENGRWLFINVEHGWTRNDIFIQDLAHKGSIVPLVSDLEATFSLADAGDSVYLMTDWQAPNRRVLLVDLIKPQRENWHEVIPTGTSVIDGLTTVGGKLCVNYLENVQSSVRIFEPNGKFVRAITFPAIGSVSGMNGRWDNNEAFFSFASFFIPNTIYRYDVAKDNREVWAKLDIPVDAEKFEVKQVWYASKDGTRVPMFVMYRKELVLDGARPTLLTGYGGFNISETPDFSVRAVMWAEQGGVYALPNLRGGGEFGESWHNAGMFEHKQNVFDDFHAAAEYLIAQKYTNPEKLAISGGSNGGLLVGAALTQRPELFRAVLCRYPLLDMIRYHKFLMGPYWVPEYGSADDSAQFAYIAKYSPYQNVRRGTKYPAVMFVTGDSDTRVAPLHARKMAALLQASTGSDRPILMHYDTQAGHSGGAPVRKQIEDNTDELSFLFWQLGMMPK